MKLKRSALIIQKATRLWITCRNQVVSVAGHRASNTYLDDAAERQKFDNSIAEIGTTCQTMVEIGLETKAAGLIQMAWLNYKTRKSLYTRSFAATKIQSHFRGWILRRNFLIQKEAAIQIQSYIRCLRCWRLFQQYRFETKSAILVQTCVRSWIAWRRFRTLRSSAVVIQVSFCKALLWLSS